MLELPVLYLSGAIIRSKTEYYRLLHGVTTDGDWEPWIIYMLRSVEETARWTTERIVGIRDLMRSMARTIKSQSPGVYSRELVELVFMQPYCRIQNVVEAGIAKRQTAAAYLKRLTEIGMLREVRAGREKLFVNRHLLQLLLDAESLERSREVR